jgi:hypothetical protein
MDVQGECMDRDWELGTRLTEQRVIERESR